MEGHVQAEHTDKPGALSIFLGEEDPEEDLACVLQNIGFWLAGGTEPNREGSVEQCARK
jgi:hypothetical protein